MSISSALSNAVSGLTLSARRAEVTSNNIANALTEGYARREIESAELVVSGKGSGVRIVGVNRAADPALTGARRLADADTADSQARSAAIRQIAELGGAVDDPNSIFAGLSNLETALAAIGQTPEDGALQENAVQAARNLVETFNGISTAIDDLRAGADADIAQQVATLNDTLESVSELSRDIAGIVSNGGDPSALEDERQRLLDTIGEIVPIRTVNRSNGGFDVLMSNGQYLIQDNVASEFEFNQTPLITQDMAYNGGAGPLSGLTLNGRDVTPGASSRGITGGSIAAAFAIRDEIAPAFATQIDGMARDLVERFQDPAADTTLGATDPGLFTDDGAFFDPVNEAGLAGRLSLNAAIDPEQGGEVWRIRDGLGAATPGAASDGSIPQALLSNLTELRAPPASVGLSGEYSAADAAARLASLLGADAYRAESNAAADAARSATLVDRELDVSGVDTDTELATLVEIEKAYAANARVLQVADQMIQQLLEI